MSMTTYGSLNIWFFSSFSFKFFSNFSILEYGLLQEFMQFHANYALFASWKICSTFSTEIVSSRKICTLSLLSIKNMVHVFLTCSYFILSWTRWNALALFNCFWQSDKIILNTQRENKKLNYLGLGWRLSVH